MREGAAGAVIGGYTRDSGGVAGIGFPVFARGNTCQDVRTRAVFDAMNVPIRLQGVDVYPGDLVFADGEGVVVVPRGVETAAVESAFKRALAESRLLLDVATGIDMEELTAKYGFF
jgi:regulator of RNase E activity RraA